MKWPAKLSKIKPVPLASSAASLLLSGYFVTQGMAHLGAPPSAHEGALRLEEVDDRPGKKAPAPSAASPSPSPRLGTEQVAQNVLERNIFDSSIGSIAWEERQARVEVEDSD